MCHVARIPARCSEKRFCTSAEDGYTECGGPERKRLVAKLSRNGVLRTMSTGRRPRVVVVGGTYIDMAIRCGEIPSAG